MSVNLIILGTICYFVTQNPQSSRSVALSPALLGTQTATSVANPLDQLSSADIALTVARLNNLPETTAITNQADSQASELRSSLGSTTVSDKPQVVLTALKSKADIKTYKTLSGDTVSSIAVMFGVTSDSVRWSNNISGDAIVVGTNLSIPPVNGIVHTVIASDTADSLANKFKASKDQIIAFNDAEINGLRLGDKIIIPNGSIAAPVSVVSRSSASPVATGFAFGSSAVFGFNGYDYGYCTWYVANRRADLGNGVPANLGDAYTWASRAAYSGMAVGNTPRPGAVAMKHLFAPGHVALVESVNDDGSFWISEMNSRGQRSINDSAPAGGFGAVDWKLIPAGAVDSYTYIY